MIDIRLAELQWQQQDLASVLSCSQAYVSAVITGRKRLAVDGAIAFATALNLSAIELLREQNIEILDLLKDDDKYHAIRQRAAEVAAIHK